MLLCEQLPLQGTVDCDTAIFGSVERFSLFDTTFALFVHFTYVERHVIVIVGPIIAYSVSRSI